MMQMPRIIVEEEPRDVVISRHDIEIDDARHAGRRPADRTQDRPDRLLLDDEGRGLVVPDLAVVHLRLDPARGPIELLGSAADGLHQIG